MKTEFYETSRKCAGKLCGAIKSANAGRVMSDCMLAGLNIVEETGVTPSHPIEVLRDAYGLGEPALRPPAAEAAAATLLQRMRLGVEYA